MTENKRLIQLQSKLKKLQTTVTFLNTGAHPDDERSDLLSYLSRGLGVRTVTVNANRGEGGQNQIGSETGNALGIIRTKEMQKAAEILDIEAYHLSETINDSIYDHGLEKSKDITLKKWGKEKTYERLIRKIREIKPDIILPSFRDHSEEHGHHRAMTDLTIQAFYDAARDDVFPEQLKAGLTTWQAKKLYLPAETDKQTTLSVEVGDVDPLTDKTYPQIGEMSRAFHKTQGMGEQLPREARSFRLQLVDQINESETDDDLFAHIAYDFADYRQYMNDRTTQQELVHLQDLLEETVQSFPHSKEILQKIHEASELAYQLIDTITRARIDKSLKVELLNKLHTKLYQLNEVGFLAANVEAVIHAPTTGITVGESQSIQIELINHGDTLLPILFTDLALQDGWQSDYQRGNTSLAPYERKRFDVTLTAPSEHQRFNPYDAVLAQLFITIPFGRSHFTKVEHIQDFHLYPKLGVRLHEKQMVINVRKPKSELTVYGTVTNYQATKTTGIAKLVAPKGWQVIDNEQTIHLHGQKDEKTVKFTVIPPKDLETGDLHFFLEFVTNDETYQTTIQEITYDHIGTALHEYEAELKVTLLYLAFPEQLKVGYIDSGFDEVADALARASVNITKLSEIDLKYNDLSIYDTIVIGIRALLSRQDLRKYYDRVLRYVERGGHLVVQYHKPDDLAGFDTPGPYPFKIGTPSIRWRVADENAKVTVTNKDSSLFTYPNKIDSSDWSNWIQERGLYFPMEWDDAYETVVEIEDDGEEAKTSGILLAKHGKGTFIYTNLVFHRQIQEQVAGGYRIFTNLLSYGRATNALMANTNQTCKKQIS